MLVFQVVNSTNVSRYRCDNCGESYLHKTHRYRDKHCGIIKFMVSVQHLPADVAEHLNNTGASAVITFHKVSCHSLNTLQMLCVLSSMRGPGNNGIPQFGTDKIYGEQQ